jgi:hypothetical protein
VIPAHLQRFVEEFAFRRSARKFDDAARPQVMVNRAAGCRLICKPLTAK